MRRLLVILVLGLGMPLAMAAEPVPEAAMKAAFLYNFALFTEWPAHLGTLNLCVSSEDGLAAALNGIQGKDVRGMHLNVMRLTAPVDVAACHILFLGESERPRVHDWLRRVGTTPVLTVTDVDGLLEQGVMIEMFESDRRLAFEVNLNPSRRAGLTFSSKLLRLARRIY